MRNLLRIRPVPSAALAVVGLLTAGLPSAGAATISVNSTNDENVAAADNGNCALREAISAANLNGAVDSCAAGDSGSTDTISLPGGTYALTISGSHENANANGDLDVDLVQGSVAIDGPDSGTAATITQSGAGERLINATTNSVNTLTLSDVILTGGNATSDGFGGAVFMNTNNSLVISDSEVSDNDATGGGGIHDGTGGTTTITNSIIRGNSATNTFDQSTPGGGISVSGGAVTITGSLIANNTATNISTSTSAAVNAEGGGIDMGSGSTLTVRDSTISGNTATATSATAGPDANGGGIDSGSIVAITNTTFSGNSVSSADAARGGGLRFSGNPGTHVLAHNTFAGNDATGGTATVGDGLTVVGGASGTPVFRGNVFSGPVSSSICGDTDGVMGPTTDSGGNVDEGTSCDLDSGTSAESVGSAELEPLAAAGAMASGNSAGPPGDREQIPVQQPNLTSPAVDRVAAAACDDAAGADLTADERGFPRPFDTDESGTAECESGAAELYECLGEGATIVGSPAGDAGLIEGTNGPDVMHGGDGNDAALFGLDGDDRICGGAGDDTIVARQGDDLIDGGTGSDRAVFTLAPSEVTVDLEAGTATGHGSDTLTRVESATGSDNADTFIGDAQDNSFLGGAGNDTYRGGTGTGPDGDDTFSDSDFGAGPNTVDYSNRSDPLTVNVTNVLAGSGGDTAGPESDLIVGIGDVVGGAGADTITGSVNANRITGGAGEDAIVANAGPDLIFVRDGGPDSVDCGSDNPADVDSVEADLQGTDTLANCLSPDLLDFTQPPPPPDPGTGSPGVTSPKKPKCKKGRKLKRVKGKFKCVKKAKKKRR